jgi:hypothetical protein
VLNINQFTTPKSAVLPGEEMAIRVIQEGRILARRRLTMARWLLLGRQRCLNDEIETS